MESFRVHLLGREACGQDVVSHRFEKPPGYSFAPGQFTMLSLETAVGPERKPFTIASAPGDAYLEITTRMSGSPFKTALARLVAGQPASVSPAAGRFALPRGAGGVGILVGGVGITPIRSILRHTVATGEKLEALLCYGNRDATCIPYREELEAMAAWGVVTVHVLQDPPVDWRGERGLIDAELVRRHARRVDEMVWAVAGPPPMVSAMESVLDALEVPPSRRVVERFAGYV